MADDFACYVSSPNATFSEFVDESKTDGNSFSVLTWGYDGNTYKLYIDHIVETQSDDDYYYELYYTNGSGANGISSTSGLGDYVCCVRYSKYEKISKFDKTNIYMHNMRYSDYQSVFGSNLKDSSIYSWHGNDYCVNFYWRGFSGEKPVTPQSWLISNDIPYKTIFPTLYQIAEYPNTLWRQINGELPYKTGFPEMFDISDAPAGIWRISDDIPYKVSFPKITEMGAFCHAVNLRSVTIPKSVKKVGRFAFTYTQLKSVKIADDCEYYDTSFPKGCIINKY